MLRPVDKIIYRPFLYSVYLHNSYMCFRNQFSLSITNSMFLFQQLIMSYINTYQRFYIGQIVKICVFMPCIIYY